MRYSPKVATIFCPNCKGVTGSIQHRDGSWDRSEHSWQECVRELRDRTNELEAGVYIELPAKIRKLFDGEAS